jgi:hypothetical protein
MAKVKRCLDAGCSRYIFLDDGVTCIQAPKDKCELKPKHIEEFQQEFPKLIKDIKQTIYVTKPIKLKEGDESPF